MAGGFNLYQYAPNALMWIDPWGLACIGRKGKKARLVELANDPKQPKHIRGWLKNEIRAKKRRTIRNPKSYDLVHARGYESASSTFRFLKDKEIAKQLADNEQIPNNGSNEIDDDIPF